MKNLKKAYLAGGCFWGLEELFRKRPGVVAIEAGYTGGRNENPTYQNHPGHASALAFASSSILAILALLSASNFSIRSL